MDVTKPKTPEAPVGKYQVKVMDKLRRAKGQSIAMPKARTDRTKSEVRAIRALERKGIVIIMGDRYARIR